MIVLAVVLSAVAAQLSPVEVVLAPDVIRLNQCQALYLQTGSFGGVRSYVPPSTFTDHIIRIPTDHEGIPADHLQAVVWCPRRGVWTLDLNPSQDTRRRFAAPLTDIRHLGVSGIVQGWVTLEEPLRVHVDYQPSWICAFFRLADCAFAPWPVWDSQFTKVGTDGSFVALLPDFAQDAVISAFGMAGEFQFSLQDKDGNQKFVLRPAGAAPNLWGIPVHGSYSGELRFTLEPPR